MPDTKKTKPDSEKPDAERDERDHSPLSPLSSFDSIPETQQEEDESTRPKKKRIRVSKKIYLTITGQKRLIRDWQIW